MATGESLALLDRFEDECGLLLAHPAHRTDSAFLDRRLEIVERAHAQLAIEHRDRFRPDALQVEQIENRRRKFRDELTMVRRIARARDLADAGRKVLADAGNLAQPRVVQPRELVWMVRDDVGAVA